MLGIQPRTEYARQAFCLLSYSPSSSGRFSERFQPVLFPNLKLAVWLLLLKRATESDPGGISGSLKAFDFLLSLAVWAGKTEHGFSRPRILAPRSVAISLEHGATLIWF